LPLLVSNLPELRRIVESNNIGWVGDLSTPEKIAHRINYALSSDAELELRRKNAIRAFETMCWEEEEKKLIQLYQSL
jgi:hypothetical protein